MFEQLSIRQWCQNLQEAVGNSNEIMVSSLLSRLTNPRPHLNPLRVAIVSGRWDWVRDILRTILMTRQLNDHEIASLLISLDCPLEPVVTSYDCTRVAKLMIDQGVNVEYPYCECICTTPLHQAVWAAINYDRGAGLINYLLESGAEPNGKDETLSTALHLAPRSRKHSYDIVKTLLDHGAMVNAIDAYGRTPMFYALRDSPDERTVGLLLEQGGLLKPGDHCLRPHEHLVWNRGSEAMFLHLLDCEIDVDETDSAGNTMLHYAFSQGNYEIGRWLLQRGANPSLPNAGGVTPVRFIILHYKSQSPFKNLTRSKEVLKLCFEYGADFNDVDSNGRTLLSEAYAVNISLAIIVVEEISRLYHAFVIVEENQMSRSQAYTYSAREHRRHRKIIQSLPFLYDHFHRCQRELLTMHTDKFYEDISLYVLLEATLDELVEFRENNQQYLAYKRWMYCNLCRNQRGCPNMGCWRNKYPIYGEYLQERIKLAEKMLTNRVPAAEVLMELFEFKLPYDVIIEHIVPQLDCENLQLLVRGYHL